MIDSKEICTPLLCTEQLKIRDIGVLPLYAGKIGDVGLRSQYRKLCALNVGSQY